jgi:CRP-like cAMP-binding protein
MEAALAKLSCLAKLSEDDLRAIVGCARGQEHWGAGSDICGEGQHPAAKAIVSGWAARMRMLEDGRRQIFGFLVPGDIVGLRARPTLGFTVTALTHVETVDVTPLRVLVENRIAIAEACASSEDMEGALLLNHIVRLGRLTSGQRVIHLLLELAERLDMARLKDSDHFRMPLTQEMLAEALGFSLVHANRTIQQLRLDQMIRLGGGMVTILQRKRLSAYAGFVPQQFVRTDIPSVNGSASAFDGLSPSQGGGVL